ncbi:MAG TPA: SBBP repeat-containing protein [Ignavibacteriaceae bacterium]|nr:SBBP repeat-containing protein [Ignavibacteriaceae bacterium]
MKKVTFSLFIVFISLINNHLFSQHFQWAKAITGGDYEFTASGVSSDYLGNVYVVGNFVGTADFGTVQLQSYGNYTDVFIAKYNSEGVCIWAQKGGGSYTDYGMAVTTDSLGNSYITGYFNSDSILFGDHQVDRNGTGGPDIFIAKYDKEGFCVWAKGAGGTQSDYGESITLDKLGYFYLGGSFFATANFDNFSVSSLGYSDAYLAKYDTTGNCVWVQRGGGTNADAIYGVASNGYGTIYVTGNIGSTTADFGIYNLTSFGNHDIFVAKYDLDGLCLWAKHAGGTAKDYGRGISTFDGTYCVITGDCQTPALGSQYITFDSIQFTTYGEYDAFIAMYNSSGNCVWAKKAGGSAPDRGIAIHSTGEQGSFITGFFSDNANFGGHNISSNDGSWDVFVAQYNNFGDCNWVLPGGGSYQDIGYGITVDRFGKIIMVGENYSNPGYYGGDSILPGAVIAKLSPTGMNLLDNEITKGFNLAQNYPNPFNPSTQISYSIPSSSMVSLKIYDVLGNEVKTLINEYKEAGYYEVTFEAKNLSNGVYFYELNAGEMRSVKKLVLLK